MWHQHLEIDAHHKCRYMLVIYNDSDALHDEPLLSSFENSTMAHREKGHSSFLFSIKEKEYKSISRIPMYMHD